MDLISFLWSFKMEINSKKNYWDTKPDWCQPWTIISFGFLVLIFCWKLFNNVMINSILAFFIFVWWIVFLILAPKFYQEINDKE
tara:strand:- start:1359 stop:1610 length:252 start_codon:yes stop_codon:yes gene_type:complete